jgi:thermitase
MRSFLAGLVAFVVFAPSVRASTNDPLRPQQYGLDRIHAEQAWARATGDGVRIAIVDSGVDTSHPDLSGKVVLGRDFVDDDDDPADEHWHGTFVAGIAAAVTNNGIGIAGVAPDAHILAVRVLDAENRGFVSDFAAGVRYAADHGAHVINLSLAHDAIGPTALVPGMDDAASYAWSKGAVIVAAAGNASSPLCSAPAFSPFVLCVGASTETDARAAYSNYGVRLDVVAPGSGVVSTYPGAQYATGSGTSFAAPHVSGVAALLMSLGASNVQVVRTVRCSADDLGLPGYDLDFGWGRVNAERAVEAFITGAC